MKPDDCHVCGDFNERRNTRLETLRLINTHVGQAIIPQEGQHLIDVLIIHPGIAPKLDSYSVLRYFLLAAEDIIPLLLSRVELGWELQQYYAQLVGTGER